MLMVLPWMIMARAMGLMPNKPLGMEASDKEVMPPPPTPEDKQ